MPIQGCCCVITCPLCFTAEVGSGPGLGTYYTFANSGGTTYTYYSGGGGTHTLTLVAGVWTLVAGSSTFTCTDSCPSDNISHWTKIAGSNILMNVAANDSPCTPTVCPCPDTFPSSWPCNGLNEVYVATFTFRQRVYVGAIGCASTLYSDCTKTVSINMTFNHITQCYWGTGAESQTYTDCHGDTASVACTLLLIAGNWTLRPVTGLFVAPPGGSSIPFWVWDYPLRNGGATPIGVYSNSNYPCKDTGDDAWDGVMTAVSVA